MGGIPLKLFKHKIQFYGSPSLLNPQKGNLTFSLFKPLLVAVTLRDLHLQYPNPAGLTSSQYNLT